MHELFQYRAWAISESYLNTILPFIMGGKLDLLIKKKTSEDFFPRIESLLQPEGSGYNIDQISRLLTVKSGSKNVAIIPMVGPLTKYGDACTMGLQDYQNLLARANQSPSIDGTLFLADTPGGSVDGLHEFATAIKGSSKPVGFFADGLLASAGVYLAAQASVVVANKNNPITEIGSIGTIATISNFAKMMEAGNMPEVLLITAPQSTEKLAYDPTKPITQESIDYIESKLKPLAQMFIDVVKSGRGDKLNTATEGLFKGRMYSSQEAKTAGLIDSIGSFKTAIDKVAELSREKAKQTLTSTSGTSGATVNKTMKFPKLSALFSGEAWVKAVSAFTEDEAPLEAAEQKVADMEANLTKATAEKEAASIRAAQADAKVTELTAQVSTLTSEKATLEGEKKTLTDKLAAAPVGAATTVIEGDSTKSYNPTSVDAEAEKYRKLSIKK